MNKSIKKYKIDKKIRKTRKYKNKKTKVTKNMKGGSGFMSLFEKKLNVNVKHALQTLISQEYNTIQNLKDKIRTYDTYDKDINYSSQNKESSKCIKLPEEFHNIIKKQADLKEFQPYFKEGTFYYYIRLTTPEMYIDNSKPFDEINLIKTDDHTYNNNKEEIYKRDDYNLLDDKYKAKLIKIDNKTKYLKIWPQRNIDELKTYINSITNRERFYLLKKEFDALQSEEGYKLDQKYERNDEKEFCFTYIKKQSNEEYETQKEKTLLLKQSENEKKRLELLEHIKTMKRGESITEEQFNLLHDDDKERDLFDKVSTTPIDASSSYNNLSITKYYIKPTPEESANNERKKQIKIEATTVLLKRFDTINIGDNITIDEYNLLPSNKQKLFKEIRSIHELIKYERIDSEEKTFDEKLKNNLEEYIEKLTKMEKGKYTDPLLFENYKNKNKIPKDLLDQFKLVKNPKRYEKL